jgi:hypothetical protein
MRPASEADSETLSDIPEESALDGDRARSSSRRTALLATAAAQQSASFVTRAVLLIPLLAFASLATLLLLRWWTRLPRRALPAACSSLVLLPWFLAAPYSGGVVHSPANLGRAAPGKGHYFCQPCTHSHARYNARLVFSVRQEHSRRFTSTTWRRGRLQWPASCPPGTSSTASSRRACRLAHAL